MKSVSIAAVALVVGIAPVVHSADARNPDKEWCDSFLPIWIYLPELGMFADALSGENLKAQSTVIHKCSQFTKLPLQGAQDNMTPSSLDAYRTVMKLDYDPPSAADRAARTRRALRSERVVLEMTAEQVTKEVGKPLKVNRSVGAWGTREQWVYGDVYLYIENGILTSFQD